MGCCFVDVPRRVDGKGDEFVCAGILAPPVVTDYSVTSSGLTAFIRVPYLVLLACVIYPYWFFCNCWTTLKLRSYSSLVVF